MGGRTLSALAACAAALALGGSVAARGADAPAAPAGALSALHGPGSCLGGPGCAPLRGLPRGGDPIISVSPDGRSLYVAAWKGLAIVSREADGRLRQLPGRAGCVRGDGADGCRRVPGLKWSGRVVVPPDGTSAYLVTSRGLISFRRAPATGSLIPLRGRAGCIDAHRAGCTRLRGVTYPGDDSLLDDDAVVAASDSTLYVGGAGTGTGTHDGGAIAVLTRDPATGALHQPAGVAGCVSGGPGGGCAHSDCLDDQQALALTSRGGELVVGSTQSLDEESTGDGALATFGIDAADHGSLTPLGCARTTNAISDVVPVPGSADVLLSTLSGNRGTGRVYESLLRATPGADGHYAPAATLACTNRTPGCHSRIGSESYSLRLTPDGRTLYVSSDEDGIVIMRRGAHHLSALPGALSCLSGPQQGGHTHPCTRTRHGGIGTNVAVSPDGRDLYSSAYRVTPDEISAAGIRAYAIAP